MRLINNDTPEPASFKETLILNLQRNKNICLANVELFQKKAVMCEELVELLQSDEGSSAAGFAEKMQKLQEGVPQG